MYSYYEYGNLIIKTSKCVLYPSHYSRYWVESNGMGKYHISARHKYNNVIDVVEDGFENKDNAEKWLQDFFYKIGDSKERRT